MAEEHGAEVVRMMDLKSKAAVGGSGLDHHRCHHHRRHQHHRDDGRQIGSSNQRNKLQTKPLLLLALSLFVHYIPFQYVYGFEGATGSSDCGNASLLASIAQPSQLFLPANKQRVQPISFVGQKRPAGEEEEEGFIMQASAPVGSVESANAPAPTTTTTTSTVSSARTAENLSQSDSLVALNSENDDNQRISIDSNRQHFVTHDQLSLLNASTKDEHINLTPQDSPEDDDKRRPQVQSSSRAGMSKVSHVSSFLSDLFAYATRVRQPLVEEEQQPQQVNSNKNNNKPQQQQTTTTTTPAACPGVCRSILTASILCRNEIVAPCPSILQKCCDKDDVVSAAFNSGTPVETSAPLAEVDSNNPAPPGEAGATEQQQVSPGAGGSGSVGGASSSPSPPPTTTTAATTTADAATAAGGTSPDDIFPAATGGTVYFLSSAGGERNNNNSNKQQVELAKPVNEPHKQHQLASQSFDLALNESKSKTTTTEQPKAVLVQTANGTIVHQSTVVQLRRPAAYANLSDYRLTMLQRPSSPVVYHSNVDPVKRFVETTTAASLPDLTYREAKPLKVLGCTGVCMLKSHRQNCRLSLHEHKCENESEFCCQQLVEISSTRRHLQVSQDGQQEVQQQHLKVLNDQHSGGNLRPQATTTTTTTPTTSTTSTTTTVPPATSTEPTTTTITTTTTTESSLGVGSVLADLLDSWITGAASPSAGQPEATLEATAQTDEGENGHATNQLATFVGPNEPQHNDRRLGLDLSFRQQESSSAQPPQEQSKCSGYCTLPLFNMLCDSTYRSHDCGPSKECCVSGRQAADEPVVSQTTPPSDLQTTPTVCNGACLPLYHSSLCTKPNELQLDSSACLANFVCCAAPAPQEPPNNLEELLQELGSSLQPTSHRSGQPDLVKQQQQDSSLLAALLPPPPPPVAAMAAAAAAALADQHLVQEKNAQELQLVPTQPALLLPATGRQRPAQEPARQQPKAGGSGQTSAAGGIMSQLYQMFKSSTSSSKQRQRERPAPVAQPLANPLMHMAPSFLNPQFYDPYASGLIRNTNQQQQQQQPMQPVQSMASFQQQHQELNKQLQHTRFNQQQLVQHQLEQFSPLSSQRQPVYQQQQPFIGPQNNQAEINSMLEFVGQQQRMNNNNNIGANQQQMNPTYVSPTRQPQAALAGQQQQQQHQQQQHKYQYQHQLQMQQHPGGSFVAPFGAAGGQQPRLPADAHQATKFNQQPPQTGRPLSPFGVNDAAAANIRRQQPPQAQQQQQVRPPPVPATGRQQQQQQQQHPQQVPSRLGSGHEQAASKQNAVSRAQIGAEAGEGGASSMQHPVVMRAGQAAAPRQPPRSSPTAAERLAPRPSPPRPKPAPDLAASSSQWPTLVAGEMQSSAGDSRRQLSTPMEPQLEQATLEGAVKSHPPRASGTSTGTAKRDPLLVATTTSLVPVDTNKLDTGAQEVPGEQLDLLDESQSEQAESTSLPEEATRKVQASCGVPGPRHRARTSSGRAKGRVMGGFEAKPNYWCWQAALMNNKNEYLCGGALIGSKWVLTAAHCVTHESPLFVRLGQHNLNSSQSERGARSVQIKTSYVHHNHNGVTLDNDVALLRMEEPVELENEPNICTVCLPERSSQLEAGKRCQVTGFGFETEQGPAALRVRQTELPVVGDLECQEKTSSVLGRPFALPASSFCAGGELGQDACHGDGGSPLSCPTGDGAYELAGIVSWGYKCGSKDLPGLYSKVSAFVGWINQIVSANN